MSSQYHLAELNIAHLKKSLEHPDSKVFVDNLEPINQLAEQSPGFIWRLKDDSANNATGIQAFNDPLVIVNLSVWDGIQNLQRFVYKSQHVEFFRRRGEWFNAMDEAHLVLWWVPAGHKPSVEEAKTRLTSLQNNGPSERAFTFGKLFKLPGQ